MLGPLLKYEIKNLKKLNKLQNYPINIIERKNKQKEGALPQKSNVFIRYFQWLYPRRLHMIRRIIRSHARTRQNVLLLSRSCRNRWKDRWWRKTRHFSFIASMQNFYGWNRQVGAVRRNLSEISHLDGKTGVKSLDWGL